MSCWLVLAPRWPSALGGLDPRSSTNRQPEPMSVNEVTRLSAARRCAWLSMCSSLRPHLRESIELLLQRSRQRCVIDAPVDQLVTSHRCDSGGSSHRWSVLLSNRANLSRYCPRSWRDFSTTDPN